MSGKEPRTPDVPGSSEASPLPQGQEKEFLEGQAPEKEERVKEVNKLSRPSLQVLHSKYRLLGAWLLKLPVPTSCLREFEQNLGASPESDDSIDSHDSEQSARRMLDWSIYSARLDELEPQFRRQLLQRLLLIFLWPLVLSCLHAFIPLDDLSSVDDTTGGLSGFFLKVKQFFRDFFFLNFSL